MCKGLVLYGIGFFFREEAGRPHGNETCHLADTEHARMVNEMKANLTKSQPDTKLARLLVRNKWIKQAVVDAARELVASNVELKNRLNGQSAQPEVADALRKNQLVEIQVQNAADDLSGLYQELTVEIRRRYALEYLLVEAERKAQTARFASLHDALTGLPNRTLFHERMAHDLANAKRHNLPLAVLFMDLNGFKRINDHHGHAAGDRVLRHVSERLKAITRDVDTLCRLGGDEFLYLLVQAGDKASVTLIVKRVLRAIRHPCDVNNRELDISGSIGIAMFPQHGDSPEALIEQADRAMYRAKKNKSGYSFARGWGNR